MWNLKTKINTQNRNRLKDTENKLMVVGWEEGWGLGEKGAGVKKYKLAVTK